MNRLLIQGGRIITAVDDFLGDILVEGETIRQIDRHIPVTDVPVLNAAGKLVIPGGIDPHTHLDMPFGDTASTEDFSSGTMAAAFGGTTTIIDFAMQSKGRPLRQGLEIWRKKAEGQSAIDYGFHLTITDLSTQAEQEMDALVAEGVPSFKLFTAYRGKLMLDDGSIFRAFLRTAENGGTVCLHCENGDVIDVLIRRALAQGNTAPHFHALCHPSLTEAEAVYRGICLAEMAGAPLYIVHLSAAEALEHVVTARDRGLPIYAETCPQYLFLSYDNYLEPGFAGAKYVMSPPLRALGNADLLWRGLQTDYLQVIATDHCSFTMREQKILGRNDFSQIPNGAPGIETRMALVFDGGVVKNRISLNRFVELTSTAAARIFGLFPRKGTIAPGSDADLVIFDPQQNWTISAQHHHLKVDYTPYEGLRVQGRPETVLSRGTILIDQGQWVGPTNRGIFLKRNPRS